MEERIVVTDIDISFISWMKIIFKMWIAAIPVGFAIGFVWGVVKIMIANM